MLRSRFQKGYFMLEVVLALGIAALVMFGVFALANGSLAISSTIATEGRTSITRSAFLTFLGRNFEQLPGNAVLNLKSTEGGRQWLSEMTFQNVPVAFSWAGQALSAEAVQLATVETRNNRLDIVLRYYEEAILDDGDSTGDARAEPVAEIVLLRDVYRFEWEVLDGRNIEEWQYDWEVSGKLPLQLRLTVHFTPDEDVIEHYFWITPKANPEQIMRSISGGSTGGRNTDGEENNPDDNPPQEDSPPQADRPSGPPPTQLQR